MAPMDEVVLLLHGLSRTRLSLWVLERDLIRAGYRVVNESYPSHQRSVDELAARLAERLTALDEEPSVWRIHIVTHSMGGILARVALAKKRPKKMGRVVMLAPPNHGSRLARLFSRSLGRYLRPLDALSDAADSLVNRLGPAPVEVGIIAAAWDGKVPIESTHLAGEADHLVVPSTHTWLMNRRDVRRQTEAFLRDGRFRR
jgi:pimeloyl-ACP methyl ester carboxylesterase